MYGCAALTRGRLFFNPTVEELTDAMEPGTKSRLNNVRRALDGSRKLKCSQNESLFS